MKVCLINNLYKPYTRGGAERVAEITARGLQKLGHEVFIITTRPLLAAKKETSDEGIKIYRFRIFNFTSYYHLKFMPKFTRLLWHFFDMFDLGSFLKIKKILKAEKPDLVITHNLKGVGYLTPLAIKRLRLKHFHVLHDIQLLHPSGLMLYGRENLVERPLAKIYAYLGRWLFSSPAAIISPSAWLLEMHRKKGFFRRSKLEVLPNPAEVSVFPAGAEFERQAPDFRFLFVGQLEEFKGVLFLLRCFLWLCAGEKEKSCELLIIGDGEAKKKAEKLARDSARIKFLGRLERAEVLKKMAAADCLVVPSLCYENSPTVIYEALSAGLPVLAARLGGMEELLKSTGGLFFTPGNEGDLMHQMRWALNHQPELAEIGKMAKEKIKEFSAENYLKSLLNIGTVAECHFGCKP